MYATIIPLVNVVTSLFICYAIIRATTEGSKETETTVRVAFSIYFPLFLIMGFCFSAGVYLITAMQDKKSGMRSMLKAIGVTTLPYFTGLFLADFIIAMIPNLLFTVILLAMNYLMPPDVVMQWSAVYLFFASSMIVLSYCFHHLFDDPETAIRYVGLIYLGGCLLLPTGVSLGIAAIFNFESSWVQSLSVWFVIDPLLTFALTTYNFCIKTYDHTWQIKMFGFDDIPAGVAIACLAA